MTLRLDFPSDASSCFRAGEHSGSRKCVIQPLELSYWRFPPKQSIPYIFRPKAQFDLFRSCTTPRATAMLSLGVVFPNLNRILYWSLMSLSCIFLSDPFCIDLTKFATQQSPAKRYGISPRIFLGRNSLKSRILGCETDDFICLNVRTPAQHQ